MERRRHEHDFEEEWREAGISRGYSYTDYNVNGRNIERIVEPETVEQVFKNLEVPSWRKQITIRAMVTSIVLSFVFNFVICKLSLTTGIIPSFNVAAGLLGFAFVKAWVSLIEKFGLLKQPFTRQENTVIQTCVVAASGIAFNSMFSFIRFFEVVTPSFRLSSKAKIISFLRYRQSEAWI